MGLDIVFSRNFMFERSVGEKLLAIEASDFHSIVSLY